MTNLYFSIEYVISSILTHFMDEIFTSLRINKDNPLTKLSEFYGIYFKSSSDAVVNKSRSC